MRMTMQFLSSHVIRLFNVVTSVSDPEVFELTLYDRWGRVLFVSDEPSLGWSGEAVPIGIYTWQLRMRDALGGLQQRNGHVALIR